MRFVASLLLLAAQAGAPAEPVPVGLPLTGAEAERFLATATVVDLEKYQSLGITHPRRAILSDGQRTLRAVFKDIEETHDREQLSTGQWLLNLKDSYKHEIAAYQLSELLGLGLVPPCIERRIEGDIGSLCLWIEGSTTEAERAKAETVPPNVVAYNDQMHDIKLFMQLTWDTDYNNVANILIGPDWKLYKVDSSRAFRQSDTLRREDALMRFRRRTLNALESLTRERMDASLGPWISEGQLDGLWQRRCRILELARERVARQGEAAVLYD
ncbi:MAG: hypothetical protein C3F15_04340 [Holophagae bacterium]|nr:MAG: hypothetical protein C3F15_04340 [Holophagae bacterium]